MKKLLAVSAVAMMVASAPAFAADPIRPAPIVPVGPVVDSSSIWDGFYAGLNVGYGWGHGEVNSTTLGAFDDDIDGWLGGAQVGYNFSSGGMVFGMEADIQAANIVYTEDLGGGDSFDIGIGTFGTVRARIGADMGMFMPYVTAGVAYGEHFYKLDVAGLPNISDSEWAFGWAAGVGAEAMLMDNVSLKAEYLYVDLGESTFNVLGDDITADSHAHTARIGVNFHF